MLDADAVGDKYAGARPGFELVHAVDVGLPYYRLLLDALVQERKPVGPIDEFVLRGIAAGLDGIDDISGMLGLDRALVEQTIVEQSCYDNVDYRLEGERRVLRLTPLGERALDGWMDLAPVRTEVQVGFDRITWRVSGRHMRELIRPRDARERGLLELPTRLKRRIETTDLEVDDVAHAIKDQPFRQIGDADLISILDVGNHRMILPAVALVYATPDGSDGQVALVIDGRISEDHGLGFAEIDGPNRSGLLVEGRAPADETPRLPPELSAKAADRSMVAALEQRIARAASEVERSTTATATAIADESEGQLGDARERLRDAEQELREARQQLEQLPIRSIQTYEHRKLLAQALATADRRLLIISPWIRSDVVNEAFLSDLEKRLRNGVHVHIGYGIGGDEEDERSDRPVRALEQLSRQFPAFVFRRLGNTHAKVLVWDDQLVVTSFNWLSFRGDPRRGFRQEEGTLISEPAYVASQYDVFRRQIEDD